MNLSNSVDIQPQKKSSTPAKSSLTTDIIKLKHTICKASSTLCERVTKCTFFALFGPIKDKERYNEFNAFCR